MATVFTILCGYTRFRHLEMFDRCLIRRNTIASRELWWKAHNFILTLKGWCTWIRDKRFLLLYNWIHTGESHSSNVQKDMIQVGNPSKTMNSNGKRQIRRRPSNHDWCRYYSITYHDGSHESLWIQAVNNCQGSQQFPLREKTFRAIYLRIFKTFTSHTTDKHYTETFGNFFNDDEKDKLISKAWYIWQ